MRVLLWSPWGAGEHYSGPGMSAFRLYSADATSRFQLTLAHGRADHRSYDLYQQQVLVSPIAPGVARQLRFLRAAKRWLAKNHHRFDVMHGLWGYEATVGPAVVAESLGLPAVVKIAAFRADLGDKSSLRSLLGLTRRRRDKLKRLSGVIAISRAIREELLEYGVPEQRVVSIPNGVDAERYRPIASADERSEARRRLGFEQRPTLVFVGTIERRKRPLLIVQAVARLRRQGHDCQLVLVGPEREPDYTRQLRHEIERRGVSDAIHLVGMQQDLRPFYHAADLFVLPSANEGMPNALLEAMASGLPSVVTRISGTVDLINEGVTGRFVAANEEDTASAIQAYLDAPLLAAQHGAAARERVLQEFSAPVVLEQHFQLFRRIIQNPPR